MSDTINVTRSSMPAFEEYCEEIRELWDSHWLTNMGVKHRALQQELERFLGVPHVTLYTNGHLALENALAALSLPQGAEVITTPFTFASTTHAIVRCGLTPVFCDVRPEDYTLDPDRLEGLITERTAAIVPVHVYGNVCRVERIEEIARRHGLKVVYDAAHAFGVRYRGRSAGSFGDIAMFSFHATKVFNTVEGGALCYADDGLVQTLDAGKNFGLSGQQDCLHAAGNAKMSEFHAAMGLCHLRHLDAEMAKRRIAAERYRERLSGVKGIRLCEPQPEVTPNYAYFPVLFDGYQENRDELFEKLSAQGIVPRKYFYPLTSDFACYRDRYQPGDTPIARHVAQNVLTLPMYADLTVEDVDRICDVILA